jgi:hypothetical protein
MKSLPPRLENKPVIFSLSRELYNYREVYLRGLPPICQTINMMVGIRDKFLQAYGIIIALIGCLSLSGRILLSPGSLYALMSSTTPTLNYK